MLSKAKLRYLKSLLRKSARSREKRFIIEGWRTVAEADAIDMLLYIPAAIRNNEHERVLSHAKKRSKEVLEVSEKEISQFTDTVTSQGIAAVVPQRGATEGDLPRLFSKWAALVVALDRIAEPGNLGSIIRTCDWFGVDALLLGEECVELHNPKVVRATVGSIFHLPIIETELLVEVLSDLKQNGFRVYGAQLSDADDIQSVGWEKKSVFVIGSEAHGISAGVSALLDQKVMIPRFGKAESLNAGTAAGILLALYKLRSDRYDH